MSQIERLHRNAQVSTLHERLLKLGLWVESSVRRLVLHLPPAGLDRRDWQRIATPLGAAPVDPAPQRQRSRKPIANRRHRLNPCQCVRREHSSGQLYALVRLEAGQVGRPTYSS